jgi:DNA-binding GntR family transcriptional regulator
MVRGFELAGGSPAADAEDQQRDSVALVSHIHAQLREAILQCQLRPGSPISQVQVAKRYGISRTPLREVLRLLEEEGLVQAQHNHRYRVSSFSLEDVVEVDASRIMLETLATRQSMRAMSPRDIESLQIAFAGMTEAAQRDDYESWQRAHRTFHQVLSSKGGTRLTASIDHLADYADRYRRIYRTTAPLAWGAGLRQHERILEAARRFDIAGTATEVAQHLARAALGTVRAVDPAHDTSLITQALQLLGAALDESAQPVLDGHSLPS